MGEIGILNVGAGDTKLTFDPAKPEEAKRAAQAVTDMLRRGYAILVEVGKNDKGPLYQRATAFDPDTHEYIIVGAPEEAVDVKSEDLPKPVPARRKKKALKDVKPAKRVPAAKARAVAVSRSAGG